MKDRRRTTLGGYRKCCEYVKTRSGIMTQCGHRANYRKSWSFCPFCGEPLAVLFNDDNMKEE